MRFLTPVAVAISLISTSASATGWIHNSAMMGQYEGGLTTSEETGISYSCSGLGSTVTFTVKGVHVSAGKSQIEVDGSLVYDGNTIYNSAWDQTSISNRAEPAWGALQKDKHNALISALAGGAEAVWTVPTGESFHFDLSGSSDIRNCLVD